MSSDQIDCPAGVMDCPQAKNAEGRSDDGTNTNVADNILWVFPVPFTDFVDVVYAAKIKGTSQLVITDVAGQVVHYEEVNTVAGGNTIRVDFTDRINPGVYFLTIKHPDGPTNVSKIIRSDR
jgi:Secretion system C-terminal sorting domain